MRKKIVAGIAAVLVALAIPAAAFAGQTPSQIMNYDLFGWTGFLSNHNAFFQYFSCGAPSGICLQSWDGYYVTANSCQQSSYPAYCEVEFESQDQTSNICYLQVEFPSSSSYWPWITDIEVGGTYGCDGQLE